MEFQSEKLGVLTREPHEYFGLVLTNLSFPFSSRVVSLECISMDDSPLALISWVEDRMPTLESRLAQIMERLFEWVVEFYKDWGGGFSFEGSFTEVCASYEPTSITLFESGGSPPIHLQGNIWKGFSMEALPMLCGQDLIFEFDASVNLVNIRSDG